MCLVCFDEKKLNALPRDEYSRFVFETKSFIAEFRSSEHFVAVERLRRSRAASTVRLRDGRLSATDGPFAKTKEQLAGVVVIEAPDRERRPAIPSVSSWSAA